ncbi:MAG: short-chain dehydrogenase, partial [Mesorhizobium sp.]
ANTGVNVQDLIPEAYADFARAVFGNLADPAMAGALTTREIDVAEGVWRAVNDTTGTLRFPAGADAVALAGAV